MQGCEIRGQIGRVGPVNPETMSFLAVATRPPYRADFEAMNVGKAVYFALRGQNTGGDARPWSRFSAR